MTRAERNYNKVFSTPQGSKEREQAMASLSDSEIHELYRYDAEVTAGRIKPIKVDGQEEHASMSYETWKRKMSGDCLGKLQELSAFAQKYPKTYEQYRQRFNEERDEERRLNNMQKVCS